MKKIVYILSLLVFACNSEDANDCFQTSGDIIQVEIDVASFDRILVNRDIELVIKEAPDFKVTVETGENLINDVEVEVIGDRLVLTDNNTCNYVRDFGITKVFVEAPNLTEVRSSTQYDILSDGVLNYDNLELYSDDFFAPDSFTNGDFRLQVNSEELRILVNNISFQYISGEVNKLTIIYPAGSGRFEGEDLIAQDVQINHRGSNDIVVNPQQSLTGLIRGTGNVISVNEPPLVDVEIIYTGDLIFN
ncbi:head GIN domain-containing protein [Winogradskyella vincentii]|uniref:DUF2807 domain-containing protein n=1 Tax=Winogradskyella vincentii TaxID=2877122 RepID=A0ABS7Y2Z1_9FLAO|nr:head GIN domain-containing protein [Winogradskyella vincentii]MCA0154286.1 DUF2807 domain-containing protein [Winogradskyella vincentii]